MLPQVHWKRITKRYSFLSGPNSVEFLFFGSSGRDGGLRCGIAISEQSRGIKVGAGCNPIELVWRPVPSPGLSAWGRGRGQETAAGDRYQAAINLGP